MDTIEAEELENEIKASMEGSALTQYTVYITTDQAQAIHAQIQARRELGMRCSFSDLIRDMVDSGFQNVVDTTETLKSMRAKRVQP